MIAGLLATIAFAQITTPSALVADKLEDSSAASPKADTYALVAAKSRVLATDFILNDIGGRRLTLADYRGRVVLLDF
jgi:cytochrome oxidase Cu insertion factor (SCO1/SenC/PrrC family)